MVPLVHSWAQESAALIVLAVCLLVFRTFRERYLLLWILGWLAFFISRWTLHSSADFGANHVGAISQAEFALAVCLFAAGVCVYSHARKYLLPLLLASVALIAFAALREIYWPNSATLRLAFEFSYRLMTVAAALRVIRFRWARWEIGAALLSLSLLYLHTDWTPVTNFIPVHFNLFTDLLFGLSMLLVAFDDSRMRTRRMNVVNALTTSITRADEYGPMMLSALDQLKSLMLAKAAWFQLLEDEKMVIAQQIGLSANFLRDRTSAPIDEPLSEILREGKPRIIKRSSAPDNIRPYLKIERFHHLVIVPVMGKKSAVGALCLGSTHHLSYTPDDFDFLSSTAHQLGLAVENLRLVEEIVRSHRQWSNTFDSIQDVVLVHDAAFRIIKANRTLLEHLSLSPAEVMGKSCQSVLPHSTATWTNCPYCEDEQQGFHEGPDLAFGGYSLVSTSTYSEPASREKGTIHVVRDISDRRVEEERYRRLFEQVQEGLFVSNPSGQLLDCNDAFVQMLGYASRDEVKSMNLDAALYASPEQRELLRREVELNGYVRNFEVMLRRKDNSLITALESSFASRDTKGNIDRHQGFLLDISAKKKAEDEIRRRNRELNALNAMAVIATQSFDLDEILNLTLRQVISLLAAETGTIYLCDADETTFRRRAGWGQRVLNRGRMAEVSFPNGFGDLVTRSRTEVLTHEYLPHLPAPVAAFVRADEMNSWIWVLLWGKDTPIGMMGISREEDREYSSNDENLLVAIGRQLATTIEKVRLYEESCRAYDDLRRTQEQLLQSEKMSAVGQLISGVAHELNNPLTAILGYAQLLESEGLNEKATEFVGKLFKQAQRTHRVVQNLLSFARQRKPQKYDVDVCKVLDETLLLRDYDLKVNNIQLVRETGAAIPHVLGDPHQLEQVFLNITNNAVDAMLEAGRGGSLTVKVYTEDGKVQIDFQDSGPGIQEPNRIFEPFYTTKVVGKGTGLGLSICYGIVREHGGDISAKNAPGGGAVISVRLPSAVAAAAPRKPLPQPRRETVVEGNLLLVEDEEAVLEFERDVLAGAGAQVITSMSCEEMKVQMLNRSFDALVANGVMPGGWTAPRIYDWVKANRPGIEKHILFTFSSITEAEVRTFLQQNHIPHLVKPFEVADLIAQARRLTQKTQAASV